MTARATIRATQALAALLYCLPFACGHAHQTLPAVSGGRHETASPGSGATTQTAKPHAGVAPEPRAVAVDSRTTLVRTTLAEARWSARDAHAIWHVLGRWSRRMGFPLAVAVDLRVGRFSRKPPRWITRVQPDCSEPAGWPARLSWGQHYSRCVALYADAGAFLRNELPDPCGGRAAGWRAPGAAFLAALELGRRPVACGRTVNRFVR